MKNAHVRFGWLSYLKNTDKTTTSIRLHLDRFVGEFLPHPPRQAKAHLISVIGGDTQVAAIGAAISLTERFVVEGPGVQPLAICLERNAQCFKGSIQLSCRKKPLRHLLAMSEEFASGSGFANSGRTLLAGSEARFVWASMAAAYGLPGLPGWAEWFEKELRIHHAIMPALGIGCKPVIVRGEKQRFLNWLSWGIESNAIQFPQKSGPVRWPNRTLKQIFCRGD